MGPVGHFVPVGMQPAGGLATAFDDVAGQAARGEAVEIVCGPAELVHQRAQRHRAVDAAPGDHHLRPGIERARDRPRAEIGIGRQQPRRQRLTGIHVARAAIAQLIHYRHQVVTQHHRDLIDRPIPEANFCSACAQARGFTPPALLITRMPRRTTSGSTDAIATLTKSVA